MGEKVKAARLSVFSNIILVIGKLIIGLMMNSVSVISEAIHSGLDLIAALIAYFSVQEASKPADEQHRYGHGKIENLSGTIEALLIFLAGVIIIYHAIQKITNPVPVEGLGLGALVMAISAVVNFFVSRELMRVARKTDSIALEADAQHLRTDVITSVGVLIGLIAIQVTGVTILDPLVAIAVAILIMKTAFQLTRDSISNILDMKLPEEEEQAIIKILDDYSADFVEFHKLRTRKAGSERFIDLHLVVSKENSIETVHHLCNQIEARIEKTLLHAHILIHSEPCSQHCKHCKPTCTEGHLREN